MAKEPRDLQPIVADLPPEGLDGVKLLFAAVVLTALAAGTGWGIRGQYGHETGAMIAGTLAALTLVLLFIPNALSLNGARAAAMMATAIGIGGSMTYGQTVGLSHDSEIIGNVEAWRWGMLGLFLKGGVWIGFGGLFLGMGLGGRRYGPLEITFLLLFALGLYALGVWLINSPFDPFPANPEDKRLPLLYFSDHWDFEPDKFAAGEMKPRWETFGGYWVALIGLSLYARVVRRDRLALRLAVVGIIAGGLGFAGGQCTQSAHAWHPEWFEEGGVFGFGSEVFRHFNWWNVMETTFGAIWGAIMALGLWFNRHLIRVRSHEDNKTCLPAPIELLLACVYVTFVLVGDFGFLNPDRLPIYELEYASTHTFEFVSYWYVEIGIVLASLPLIGIAGGRIWPYLMLLVVIAFPICGKTMRAVGFDPNPAGLWSNTGLAWFCLVQVPLVWAIVICSWLIQKSRQQTAGRFAAVTLIFTTVLYFGLNTVVFGFPRLTAPLDEWGGRHPNQCFFAISSVSLVVAAIITLLVNRGTVSSDD